MQVIDGFEGGVSRVLAVGTLGILGGGLQKLQVVLEDVLNAEKNITKSSTSHERRKGFAVIGNGGGHGLHEVIQLVQSGLDNRFAQGFEAPNVQRNVVVDQENGSSAVIVGVANVLEHAVEGVGVEIASPHFDDGTEAAIVGAAARSLDYVHLPAQQRVSLEHTRIAVRRADFAVFQPVRRPVEVVHPPVTVSIGEATDLVDTRVLLDGAQQFAERDFSLAAHQIIDTQFGVGFRGKAGVVSSHHDLHSRPERAHQVDNATGGAALKRHDGQSDNFWLEFADQPGDGLANVVMNQDQVSYGHAVLRIDISRQ